MTRRRQDRPRAGEVYQAKARRGWRYVRVDRVSGNPAYATVTEVRADGRRVSGRSPTGIPRSQPFAVALTWSGTGWAMPGWYQRRAPG